MAYKIAVASSDGVYIDQTFGAASAFRIYEVTDREYAETELRSVSDDASPGSEGAASDGGMGGCQGGREACRGIGCSGNQGMTAKVETVSDCRCVICARIGFPALKQLERRAVKVFDVTCTVEEALEKITAYFYRADTHQPFRHMGTHE